MQKEIKQTWHFNQPTQEVWEYLTKPELLEQWLMKTDFQPVVGHKFQFHSSAGKDCDQGGVAYCEVLKIIPQKHLSYSWKYGAGVGARVEALDSVVIWTLAEKEGGTELQLQHSGFKLLEDLTSHTEGWNAILNRLTQLFSTTRAINSNT